MAKTEIHLSKRADNGVYQAHVAGQRISLGTRNLDEARAKVREAKLPQVAALASAGALTQQAIAAVTGAHKTGLEVLEEWRVMREANGRSPFTIAKDVDVVGRYLRELQIGNRPVAEHDERHVGSFINSPNERSAMTRERDRNSLRSYYEFALYRGYAQGNPAANVEVNYRLLSHEQKEKGEHAPFTEAQYEKLLQSEHLSDYPFFVYAVPISYASGLRVGDIACLERACVGRDFLAVHTDKSDRRVCLPLDEKIAPGLRETLRSIPEDDTPYFFPEEREIYLDVNRRSRFSVYFKRILTRSGIEGRTFHGLRSTCTRRWRALGFDLEQCKEWLGHGSSTITAKYAGEKTAPRRR